MNNNMAMIIISLRFDSLPAFLLDVVLYCLNEPRVIDEDFLP